MINNLPNELIVITLKIDFYSLLKYLTIQGKYKSENIHEILNIVNFHPGTKLKISPNVPKTKISLFILFSRNHCI
jgi:hypothetical protein